MIQSLITNLGTLCDDGAFPLLLLISLFLLNVTVTSLEQLEQNYLDTGVDDYSVGDRFGQSVSLSCYGKTLKTPLF